MLPAMLLLPLLLLIPPGHSYNTSVCSTFPLASVYYLLNTAHADANLRLNNYTYNLCHELEYYCPDQHKVVVGALVDTAACVAYGQDSVGLVDAGNVSRGVRVGSLAKGGAARVEITWECAGAGAGCPEVESSTIFGFFQDKQLGFTIALEIIGVIFMTLGVYIYRASIVLLGACTMFFILLAVQVPIVFQPGIASELISNILILSGICSFFAGYVFGYFPKLGIFMLGSWIGLIISLTLNNVAFYFIKSNPANLTLWIVMPILCVLFGVLSLFIKRAFIIFATSLIGAYMCLRGLSWYLGAFPNEFLLARKYHLGLSGPVSWKFYIYVVALIILTASSSALQSWLFQKKSKLTNQNANLDEEFGNMEAKMKAERENLAEIANIKDIFKSAKKSRAPKILKRRSESSIDQQEQQPQYENELQVQEPSEQRPAISSKKLNKRYIIK